MEASLGYSVLQKGKTIKRELGLYHNAKTHIQHTRDPGFNPLITQTGKKRVKKNRKEGKKERREKTKAFFCSLHKSIVITSLTKIQEVFTKY